jgi:hypothetical protein
MFIPVSQVGPRRLTTCRVYIQAMAFSGLKRQFPRQIRASKVHSIMASDVPDMAEKKWRLGMASLYLWVALSPKKDR